MMSTPILKGTSLPEGAERVAQTLRKITNLKLEYNDYRVWIKVPSADVFISEMFPVSLWLSVESTRDGVGIHIKDEKICAFINGEERDKFIAEKRFTRFEYQQLIAIVESQGRTSGSVTSGHLKPHIVDDCLILTTRNSNNHQVMWLPPPAVVTVTTFMAQGIYPCADNMAVIPLQHLSQIYTNMITPFPEEMPEKGDMARRLRCHFGLSYDWWYNRQNDSCQYRDCYSNSVRFDNEISNKIFDSSYISPYNDYEDTPMVCIRDISEVYQFLWSKHHTVLVEVKGNNLETVPKVEEGTVSSESVEVKSNDILPQKIETVPSENVEAYESVWGDVENDSPKIETVSERIVDECEKVDVSPRKTPEKPGPYEQALIDMWEKYYRPPQTPFMTAEERYNSLWNDPLAYPLKTERLYRLKWSRPPPREY